MTDGGATRSTREGGPQPGDLGSLGNSEHPAQRAKERRRAQELAHDLSEGLGTISLFAGSLELHLGHDLDPAAARDLAGIQAGIERMSSLVAGALGSEDDATGEHGHRPLDTNAVVRDARANLEARVAHTDARIVCEPLPWVLGDTVSLTRLFQNLLANAIEHRDPQRAPRIRIGARPEGAGWLFEVADNGRGIPAEQAAQAFGPHAQPEDGDPGPGLGLGICARIVAAHGGRIWASPRAEEGTLVSFELPRARRVETGSPT